MYEDQYQFNPFPNYTMPQIPSTMGYKNILHPELVDSLNRDNYGNLYMWLNYKKQPRQFLFSRNILNVNVYGYVSITTNSNKKFITFVFGGRMMNVKYSDIKGYKLFDKLVMLGVDFGIDAPKTKKADILNNLVIKSVLYNGFNMLEKEKFDEEYMKGDFAFV